MSEGRICVRKYRPAGVVGMARRCRRGPGDRSEAFLGRQEMKNSSKNCWGTPAILSDDRVERP
jgi:hypothetical protein